jgi:hypothetical protein
MKIGDIVLVNLCVGQRNYLYLLFISFEISCVMREQFLYSKRKHRCNDICVMNLLAFYFVSCNSLEKLTCRLPSFICHFKKLHKSLYIIFDCIDRHTSLVKIAAYSRMTCLLIQTSESSFISRRSIC